MANTQGLLARLTQFCFWPIEEQWRAFVSMPRQHVTQSSVDEKGGPHKDCALAKALHACIYMHSHKHKNTHNDAWANVRTDNLAKHEMDKMEWRQSKRIEQHKRT